MPNLDDDERAQPCPFCNSPHTGVKSRVNKALAPEHQYFLFVECVGCGARGPGIPLRSLDEFTPAVYDRSIKPPGRVERSYDVYLGRTRAAATGGWNKCG